jgi:hypothetical protein
LNRSPFFFVGQHGWKSNTKVACLWKNNACNVWKESALWKSRSNHHEQHPDL